VFIDTPTRGNRGEPLDDAALWNFAGRAGRLGEEVVGNVFLVNYENWDTQPLTHRQPFEIKVAFKETLESDFEDVVNVLELAALPKANAQSQRVSERVTAAAGLVLFRASQGNLGALLTRPGLALTKPQQARLTTSAAHALSTLGLPPAVLTSSWMIDAVSLASLLHRLRELIRKEEFDKLMPVNPSADVFTVYQSIFRRLYKHLGGMPMSGEEAKRTRGFVSYITVTALKWMRGESLTQLVNEAVKFKMSASRQSTKKKPDQSVIDDAIRDMFTTIEQTIRFKLVQWSKAYVDLLRFALVEAGRADMINQVYDFSLALELGVSTTTGRSLVEFGLSRISASAVAALITDSSLMPEKVKAWIRAQPEAMLSQLSSLVLAELRAKDLLAQLPDEASGA
jgi:hypothetical protein